MAYGNAQFDKVASKTRPLDTTARIDAVAEKAVNGGGGKVAPGLYRSNGWSYVVDAKGNITAFLDGDPNPRTPNSSQKAAIKQELAGKSPVPVPPPAQDEVAAPGPPDTGESAMDGSGESEQPGPNLGESTQPPPKVGTGDAMTDMGPMLDEVGDSGKSGEQEDEMSEPMAVSEKSDDKWAGKSMNAQAKSAARDAILDAPGMVSRTAKSIPEDSIGRKAVEGVGRGIAGAASTLTGGLSDRISDIAGRAWDKYAGAEDEPEDAEKRKKDGEEEDEEY